MLSLTEIINKIPPIKIIGSSTINITEVIKFDSLNTNPNAICWVNEKNIEKVYSFTTGVIICPNTVDELKLPVNCTFLLYINSRKAFQDLLINFFVEKKPNEFISSSAYIGKNVNIGKNVYIGHNTVIEDDVEIGDNVIIVNNNSILSKTIIKNNVQIGSNNTIGGVGFGYEKDEDGKYQVIPHIGNVIINEFVEIGNNTCIERAVLGSTVLEQNCKIDNLVHIAHGVIVGENSLVIAHAIIGGSTRIGKNCWIAPNASVINGITIGDNVTVGLAAVVVKSINDNQIVVGNPAKPIIKK